MRQETTLGKWWLGLMVGLAVVGPQSALCIQTHGHPEGLYAHQMGHVVFLERLLSPAWDWPMKRSPRAAPWRPS